MKKIPTENKKVFRKKTLFVLALCAFLGADGLVPGTFLPRTRPHPAVAAPHIRSRWGTRSETLSGRHRPPVACGRKPRNTSDSTYTYVLSYGSLFEQGKNKFWGMCHF